jgi:hypothetical protein
MMDMGFTNEGDWLRTLLDHHDGNVERVFAILEPMGVLTPE